MDGFFSVAVVEDNPEWTKTLHEFFGVFAKNEGVDFSVKSFSSGEEFLQNYKAEEFEMVLMDIDLPILNGMQTAKRLRELDKEVALIFVTNLAQYAVEGYEVDAFDFIVKPFTYYQFSIKIHRLLTRLETKRDVKFWIKVVGGERKEINSANLKYVEVIKHNVIYHTTEGNFTALGTMLNAAEQLKGAAFELCNRCYLVNLKYVTGIRQYDVIVGGETLQMSHLKRNSFLEALNKYIAGGATNV